MLIRSFLAAFVLALSIFGWSGEAQAVNPTGHSFCRNGMGEKEDFARRMERAIAADPNGNRAVDGCIATPREFLAAYQRIRPNANLTSVSQLPAYVRSWQVMQFPAGREFSTSCLQDRSNGTRAVVINCLSRTPRAGEVAYGDGEVIIQVSSCGNPGATPIPPRPPEQACPQIRFPDMAPRTPIRIAFIGRRPLPGRCHQLAISGESQPRDPDHFPEECPDREVREFQGRRMQVVCSWDAVEDAASQLLGYPASVQNVSASFYARANGTNAWDVPPEVYDGEGVVCWELTLSDGRVVWVSIGVRREDFVNGVATITPEHVRAAVVAQLRQ